MTQKETAEVKTFQARSFQLTFTQPAGKNILASSSSRCFALADDFFCLLP
jgi:hypothetical protein